MTVAAEIAHLCGDTPTAQESVLCLVCLIQYVRDNGGYVHPDLQLLMGDEAEHGQELTGWVYPDTVQAVYHFHGGVEPSDFCLGDN